MVLLLKERETVESDHLVCDAAYAEEVADCLRN